jgi:hypothetical protein
MGVPVTWELHHMVSVELFRCALCVDVINVARANVRQKRHHSPHTASEHSIPLIHTSPLPVPPALRYCLEERTACACHGARDNSLFGNSSTSLFVNFASPHCNLRVIPNL